jgi:peroxiredoxin
MEDGELSEDEEEAIVRPEGSVRGLAPWRHPVVALLWIGAIVAAIWYIGYGPGLPFLNSSSSASIASDSTFVSLQSQGIKLGSAGGPAPKIGGQAPDFTLLSVDGKAVRLSDFRGKSVVLNFWATWCPPCRKEFPELVALYNANKDRGLVVLGINLQEPPDQVRKFAQEYGATFPIVIDIDADVAGQYRLLGLPMTWFIDPQGILRAQQVGVLTKGILTDKLDQTGFAVSAGF